MDSVKKTLSSGNIHLSCDFHFCWGTVTASSSTLEIVARRSEEHHTDRSGHHFLQVALQKKRIWHSIFIINHIVVMLCTLIQTYHHSIAVILITALCCLPERQKAEKEQGVRFCSRVPYFGTSFGSLHWSNSSPVRTVLLPTKESVQTSHAVPVQVGFLSTPHARRQNNSNS